MKSNLKYAVELALRDKVRQLSGHRVAIFATGDKPITSSGTHIWAKDEQDLVKQLENVTERFYFLYGLLK